MAGRQLELFALACFFLLGVGLLARAQDPANQGYGTILGTVADPMGIGIPEVRIIVLEEMPQRNYDVTTDCSGFYRLSNLAAGRYTVRFGSKGFRTEIRTVLINPSQVTPLDVKMQVGQLGDSGPNVELSGPLLIGSIKGTVTDGHGAVIPGAHVLAIEEATGNLAETTTNAEGLFSLSGVGRGIYTVRVEARGFKTEIKRSVPVEAEASVDFHLSVGEYSGPMVIPDPAAQQNHQRTETESVGAIQGRVLDAAGAVPARISAIDEATGKRYETTTDSNGAYRFRDLPPGTYCTRFEAWAGQWKTQPEELRPTLQTSKEVRVAPPAVSEVNVTIPARPAIVAFCGPSCMFRTGGVSASHPKITLQLYVPSNVARAGNELWIKTTLTNISRHAVSVRAQKSPASTVDYQIYAELECNCPGPLRTRDADFISEPEHLAWVRQWRRMRVRSGKTVIDKVDLSKLLDFGRPGVYWVMVEYAEGLVAKHGREIKYPPVTVSNSIRVAVIADSH
ncbi:MAG TPA: carboxypeptidase-like regulatory domain-containing protein [Candidatus Angelobacter sp.]|nr:carboxypeptidase-like regulatory domain-containing protein [Candidatus Angelobacter sp.]